MNNTVVEILEKMTVVLMEKGWFKGSLEGSDGSVCMVGALNLVTYGTVGSWIEIAPSTVLNRTNTLDALGQTVRQRWAEANLDPVPCYNDLVGVGFNDVLDVIQETIVREKGECGL